MGWSITVAGHKPQILRGFCERADALNDETDEVRASLKLMADASLSTFNEADELVIQSDGDVDSGGSGVVTLTTRTLRRAQLPVSRHV